MWSHRLFWKLFLASLTLYAMATAAIITFAAWSQARKLDEQLQTHMRATVALIAREAAHQTPGGAAGLQSMARAVAAEVGMRITLLTREGQVLADSEADPATMDDHSDRPEIAIAAQQGVSSIRRMSDTVDHPMYYVALRVDGPPPLGFVRAAIPTAEIDAQAAQTRASLLSIAATVGIAALLVYALILGRIIAPVTALTRAARAIASGVFNHRVHITSRDELGALGEAFNQMGRELQGRMNQLRQNSERISTVLGSMVEGVIAVDDHQKILLANEAARNLLGVTTPDLAGRPLWEVVRNRAVAQTVEDVLDGLRPKRSEFEIAGNPRRVVASHASCLPGQPCPGVVLVLHDMTELRRLENLRRDFVANVSHELKTPLSSIKAYTETLLDGAVNDAQHNMAFLKRIEEQAERLHALIIDMLSLARIEAGREAFEIRPIEVQEIVSACVAQHQAAASSKEITLEVEPPLAPVQVRADEDGLRTILDNLVDNAIKYTPDGGKVSIRWSAELSTVRLEVRDTGIGIAAAEQPRVFERFYRVDKARSRELGGTGLGLSIVKHLVQAFSGNVSVASSLGEGATFSVWLPRV